MELDRRGAELLFQVLTEREEKNSVAIASNEPQMDGPRPSPTRACARAIVDRLTYGGNIIETGTHSYRLVFRDLVAQQVSLTGEAPKRVPGAVLGHPGTEYQPVHAGLVVEVEAEPTVETFSARLRPRVHRIRPDLVPEDIERSPAP